MTDVDEHRKVTAAAPNTAATDESFFGSVKGLRIVSAFFGASTIALLVATIVLALGDDEECAVAVSSAKSFGENPCAGKRPKLDNIPCINQTLEGLYSTGEQAGANVTKGYKGSRNTTAVPLKTSFREAGLCPVNVHWHIGAEHYSVGEYDEVGIGPIDFHEGRNGFKCRYYNQNDPKFNTPFEWKHCIGMAVGQTYEVHWPHSAAGKCNSPWQYQTPFYDGVFCGDITDTAAQIGVQSQVFTVINDEEYYYPDLFTGRIEDSAKGMGVDIAMYTGSTTGSQRDNTICSQFSPITWHVDRKCHLISASSFDKMCADMKLQADDLKDDLYAHGSRELVADEHAANNQQSRLLALRQSFGLE